MENTNTDMAMPSKDRIKQALEASRATSRGTTQEAKKKKSRNHQEQLSTLIELWATTGKFDNNLVSDLVTLARGAGLQMDKEQVLDALSEEAVTQLETLQAAYWEGFAQVVREWAVKVDGVSSAPAAVDLSERDKLLEELRIAVTEGKPHKRILQKIAKLDS